MKRTYELMVVVSPEADLKDEKKQKSLVEQLLKEQKDYTITSIELLDKKNLAYPIQKHTEGLYLLVGIESEGMSVGTIQQQAKTMPEILRFLVIRQEIQTKKGKKKKKTSKKKEDTK